MSTNRFSAILSLLLLAAGGAFGQYAPQDGAEDLTDLYSPSILAEAGPVASGSGPQADILNPAISGLVQRTTLDASYVGLLGLGNPPYDQGWRGHVVNLGVVTPTRAAVVSASFHLVAAPSLIGMQLGTSGWLHASAAKELYPGWLAGAGLRVGGGVADQFDFGLALDLGMLRKAGTLGPLEDFQWGIAFSNIGKWYDPFAAQSAMPTPFTPSAGVSFSPYSNEWLKVETTGSVTAPGLQNIRTGISARLTFFDAVTFHTGWKLDFRQLFDPTITTRSFIPSFGISGRFRTGLGQEGFAADRGWTETEIRTQTGAAQLYNGIWAIGAGVNAPLGIIDTEGPVVDVTYPQTVTISPNNDGTKDSLSVPVSITDERFVMGWSFQVKNRDGELIREIRNKDERPENEGFQSIVDRVVSVRTGIDIPETVRWDGSTKSGESAPDGEYSFQLIAEDDNGNIGRSEIYRVAVDTTPPEISLADRAGDEKIFSPNGDGNKDTLEIPQSGSVERMWEAEIVDARGRQVRAFKWQESAPESIVWNGLTDNGEIAPDGVYRYKIESVDEAGNRGSGEVANIILNTESTPVSVSISTSYFSPNGDGRQDVVEFEPDVPNAVGITNWELLVRRVDGEVVRRYGDTQVAPRTIVFDGVSESRSVIPEGTYYAELSVRYSNGNAPSARSPEFTVDLTPPVVAVQSDRNLFSPNGDDRLDTVTFFQETSREERWVGTVRNSAGAIVREIVWPIVADQQVTWNGRRDDGRLAIDGTYYYALQSTDLAGNQTESDPVEVVLDTTDAEIGISAEFEAFSPNADNTRDWQQLFLRVDRADDVRAYSVTIIDEDERNVRRYAGGSELQRSVSWNGRRDDGLRVPDGIYRAMLDVEFENGVEISARTAGFVVDTAAPTVTVTAPYLLFSPDGDGERESIAIVQTSSIEEQWSASVRDVGGNPVQEYVWAGRVAPIEWDGRDSAGNLVEDGSYRYVVSATDRAGNSTEVELSGITVDSRQPRLFVTASTTAFSPNDDGIRDDFSFDLYANLLDGVERWQLEVKNEDGLVVREFGGTELTESRTIEWDGRDGRGRLREGLYTAEFSAEYEKGNRPVATTGAVRIDTSPPEVNVTLQPLPFSPDNDGLNDELIIRPNVEDVSPIRAWRLEILDRNNRFFNEFSGQGEPAESIVWDGRAADGELVISAEDYPYRFTVSDELGNLRTTEGVIPVDILVIRDGDRLKVQISNITFAPNSPELIIDETDERGARNRAILLRLAEIFDKYSSYSIRIEGHAVNLTGTEREEREELQPLSTSRAQSVKDAMVELGISERRISVIGRGGTEPLVPHDDLDNRWKNRRVEFVLIR